MQYSLDNKNFSDEPPVATDAGTYTVWYKVKGDAKHYDVYYRVHAQQFGWMGWAKNGEQAGTAGFSYRLEAIQIVLVPKGAKAPAATYRGAQQLTARAFAEKGKA